MGQKAKLFKNIIQLAVTIKRREC